MKCILMFQDITNQIKVFNYNTNSFYCHIYVYVLVLLFISIFITIFMCMFWYYFFTSPNMCMFWFYFFTSTNLCMFWFYSAAFSLETSQIEIQLKVILYVSMFNVHRAFGQMFEKRALVLLYKSFYSTFKSFLVGLPKRNIHEVVFEVNGCWKLKTLIV